MPFILFSYNTARRFLETHWEGSQKTRSEILRTHRVGRSRKLLKECGMGNPYRLLSKHDSVSGGGGMRGEEPKEVQGETMSYTGGKSRKKQFTSK